MDLLTRPRKGVVMLTLAPELADPADLVRLAAAGVILSAGHTDASLEQALDGFAHGVRGVTHLYNAMSPLLHRAPGMVGAALTHDETYCGIIADGVHVAGTALKLALKAKGTQRLMLVTDAMPGVGNGGKPFLLDGREIFVKDGICTDAAGTLAGSGLDMAGAVRNMVALTGCAVAAASRMASATPADFLRLNHDLGTLAAGNARISCCSTRGSTRADMDRRAPGPDRTDRCLSLSFPTDRPMIQIPLVAPFDGWLCALEEVPDPVFAGRLLGTVWPSIRWATRCTPPPPERWWRCMRRAMPSRCVWRRGWMC
jgi:hypothetical protein